MPRTPPFSRDAQLEDSLDHVPMQDATLPGYPRVKLDDNRDTADFVRRDTCCDRLEKMARHLWLLSTHSGANVTPLHRQSLRGRKVVVMEDPGLHLVWRHDCIYVKPMPKYLLSHVFWNDFLVVEPTALLSDRRKIIAAALGFLRSYFYLIQHESDLRIAQQDELQLLPRTVTWERFCSFSDSFGAISDDEVSERYQYGELRLTRLNFWALPLLGQMVYQDFGLQYSDYFSPFFAPLLFVFATFSVLLSAMQVALAVEALDSRRWVTFWNVSRWFAVVSIFLSIVPIVGLLILFVVKFGNEWVFAIRHRPTGRARTPFKEV
ncbi:hypothetical protein KCU99_g9887, partial [Aureobasidium melanogenum]